MAAGGGRMVRFDVDSRHGVKARKGSHSLSPNPSLPNETRAGDSPALEAGGNVARFNLSDYPAQTAGQVRPHPLNPATTRSHRGWGPSTWVQDDCAGPASDSGLPSSATKRRPTVRFRAPRLGSQVHRANSFSAFARSAIPQKGNLAYAHSPLGRVSSRLAEGPRLEVAPFARFFSL